MAIRYFATAAAHHATKNKVRLISDGNMLMPTNSTITEAILCLRMSPWWYHWYSWPRGRYWRNLANLEAAAWAAANVGMPWPGFVAPGGVLAYIMREG
eukprot:COSAG05_NODE_639_length_8156_cov_122.162840_2_plen_98_part_00